MVMDYFYGTIQLFPYDFAPQNWVPCNGTLLNINMYQALYALLGTRFGGDGRSTFGVPDLRSAAIGPYNQYYICTQGLWPSQD